MHGSISFNFELLIDQEALISALGAASIYGKGVFTTLAIHGGRPSLWQKHWRRLKDHSASIGIDLSSYTELSVSKTLADLLERNDVTNGRARITFLDESVTNLWPHASSRGTSLLVTTANFRPPVANGRLTTSSYLVNSRSPLAGIKSCNYLEKVFAKDEAKERGFDECVQLNERGEITSASMANIFWVKDGILFTPSLNTGCLGGTTREFVLENIECGEVQAAIEQLQNADEIFLTSAGIGVVQIAEFDGRTMAGSSHPITGLLPPRV